MANSHTKSDICFVGRLNYDNCMNLSIQIGQGVQMTEKVLLGYVLV
jgi:hypothetical protein